MKTKINKILSVLATVAIVASMFVVAMPVAASTPGDGLFTLQDLPAVGTAGKNVLLPGATIRDISVGSDGKTIWVAHALPADAINIRVVPCSSTNTGKWSAGAGAYTVAYINQAGAAATTLAGAVAIPGSSVIGYTMPANIVLAVGDTGVLAVTAVTAAAGNAANGNDKFIIQGVTSGLTYAIVSNGATPTATYPITTVGTAPAVPYRIMKSSDAGQSFDDVTNNYVTVQGLGAVLPPAPVAISVAPDDVNTCAITDGTRVTITKDGGTTWALLPNPTLGATGQITDIAVAPARSGTLLGREYVISIADNGPTVALGDVQIIGNNAAWATVGALGVPGTNVVAATFDFTSVVVTPNFLGDRCVVAVGTKAAPGSTALVIVNTATNTIIVGGTAPVTGAVLNPAPTGTTTDFTAAAVGTSIATSSIALPTNFDPTSASGRRAYVGIASQTAAADNDVYRVDDTSARALGAVTSAAIYSVAYSGTTDTGILFIGQRASTDVKYTTGMTASSPTWTTTLKSPVSASAAPNVIVKVASDYATTSRLFVGTVGAESALYASNDAGVSFNAESLVDTGTTTAGQPSLAFSSDAKTVFMSAKDGNNYLTIWQSAVPFDPTSWKRIFSRAISGVTTTPANLAASLSLKNSGTALFLFETLITNGAIYASQDGGVSFTNRNGPTGVGYADAAARDTQTLYYCDTTGNVYKSTNAGWTWSTAVSSGVGASPSALYSTSSYAYKVLLPKANQVVVGATSVAISNDDGATFTAMSSGLTAAVAPYPALATTTNPVAVATTASGYTLAADTAYANNTYLYAVDTGLNTAWNIYRVKTDSTSNTWELMAVPGTMYVASSATLYSRVLGITTRSGLLYATTSMAAGGIARTLYPTDLVGNQNWKMVSVAGLAPGTGVSTTAGIIIYARVSNAIYAFNDYLATTKPTLTDPADNYADSINPTGGLGYPVDLKWKPMGTGVGQVDQVDIEIVDKANGFTGTPTVFATTVSATNPIYTTALNLQPNKVYLWRVRAAHTTTPQLIDSPWSDARSINIQAGSAVQQAYSGPILLGPQGGAQNLDPNLVGFAWAPITGATEYTVIVATDAALTKAVSGTPAKVTVPAYQATGLAYGTTYFWAVQATKPTSSIQTMGTFTTMQKPVAAAAAPTAGATAAAPPQTIIVQPTAAETPAYIWAVIAIGAILVIAVIILIVRTRRVP